MESKANDNFKYDTEHFQYRLFGFVPQNYSLVTENSFTAKTAKIKKGLHLIAPWKKSIYVCLTAKTIDYPKKKFEVKNKFDVMIDYAIEIQVVDPIAYTYSTNKNDSNSDVNRTTPESMIESRVDDVIRTLASRMTYEELLDCNFDINDHNNLMMIQIKNQLNLFANKYGLALISLNVKSINQTKEVSEKYQDYEMERINRQNAEENEASQARIKEMRAESMAKQIKYLIDSGLSQEQAFELIRLQLLRDSENAKFVNITGGNSATNFGAQFQVGADAVSENNGPQKKL